MKPRFRLTSGAVVAVLAVLTAAGQARPPASSPPGSLDTTFGGDGIVVTDIGGSDLPREVLVQPNGKVVVVGQTAWDPTVGRIAFAIVRYSVDGSLDTSFGTGGRVTTDLGLRALPGAAALLPDGRILAAGFRFGTTEDFALVRYTTQGGLDASFGQGGVVTTDFGGTRDEAWGLVVQRDGKIVVAGHRFTGASGSGPADFALARYDGSGNLDSSFGSGGRVVTDLGQSDLVWDAVIQPDGKIVVAGSTGAGFPSEGPTKIALARYTQTGSLDPTFDGDGIAIPDAAPEAAEAVALQSDGKLVVSTRHGVRFAVARFTTNGQLDTRFGEDGFAASEPLRGTLPVDVALQRNGKIVAAGVDYGAGDRIGYVVARFLPSGASDLRFGTDGVAKASVGSGAWAMTMAVAPDQRLVTAGAVGMNPGSTADFAVTRFLPGTCTVPSLVGRALTAVRGILARANCRLGTTRPVKSSRVAAGRIVGQTPAAGRELADWAFVNVTVSRGRR